MRQFKLTTLSVAAIQALILAAPAVAQSVAPAPAGAASAPGAAASAPTAPQAKPASKAEASAETQTVVVSGIRGSLQSSQYLKQNADQIIDSVTATDINALPDRSVTETLQRISGVTVDHFLADDDPDHPSAEGSGVLIRGLPYVASQLNGRESFSANNGRALGFQDVPAELMAGVDVYKNPSAEIIEGGIGGTVNLRTRMPFDTSGRVTAFSLGANRGDMAKETKPSASFLYSNRWNTPAGEFGALVDVAYSALNTRSDGIQTNPYVLEDPNNLGACPCEPTSGSGSVAVPGDINWSEQQMQRKRTGLYGALQWKPNDRLELSTQFFRSNYYLQWNQHWVQTNEGNYYDMVPSPGTTFAYNGAGVFQSGTMLSNAWKGNPSAAPTLNTGWPPLGGANYYTDNRLSTQTTSTTDWSNGFKFRVNDRFRVTGDFQLVRSTSNTVDFSVYNQFYMPPSTVSVLGTPSLVLTNPTYAYTPDKGGVVTNDPNSLTDPSNYYLGAAMDHLERDTGTQRSLRLDGEYDLDNAWLQYVRFGARFTDRDAFSNNTNSSYNWGPISQVWSSGATPATLQWIPKIPSSMEQLWSMGNFYHGANLPTTLWFPSMSLVKNYAAAGAQLQPLEIAAGGWCPQGTTDGSCTPGSPMSNNGMKEKTQAAYGSLYFGNDTALPVPVDGNIGLRAVHTSVSANGSVTFPAASDTSGGDASTISPAQLALFTGASEPIDGKTSYTDILPSLNLRFKLTKELQLRLAASKAMSRPDISQLNSYMKIGTSWTGAGAGEQEQFAGFTASTGGNPALKPMTANQFDAALEWYFSQTGSLYGTAFDKNIKDYVTTETWTDTIMGQPVAVTGPVNAGNGTVKGLEVGYQQFFDFLPGFLKGFGVQANYTYLQSSKIGGTTSCDPNHGNGSCASGSIVNNPALPMAGLSPHSYNLTGMFENSDWSARLAWSWRSKYLITPEDTGDTYLPMWSGSFGQLDGSVFYHITKDMQLGLLANNLNRATTHVLMGPTTYTNGYVDPNLYTRSINQSDRRFELVLRDTF
jgi:TonB-dependent receptor